MLRPALVLLLAAVLAGCSNVLGTVEEAGELVAEGDVRVLREPMRPIRGADRVLLIALDGVGQDLLTGALATGDLPTLGRLFGAGRSASGRGGELYEQAVIANEVPSVFPSETAPGWTAVFTGAPPAQSGVPGNEWFARDSAAVYAPVPVSVFTLEQTLAVWTDSLLSGVIAAPTVYERADLRAHVSLAFVYRGADLLTPPDASDVGGIIEAAVETVAGGVNEAYAELDEDAWDGVRRGVEEHGLPDLQVAYFPGPDLVAHASGPAARAAYLRDDVDPLAGRILDLYRERGALGSTTVVVVSDHGHTEVLEDDRHSLDTGGADEPPALLGWRVHDFEIGPVASDADVVMTYNEAVATLTVADRSTCPEPGDACDWTAPPRLEEDVLPLARALRAASAPADTAAVGGGSRARSTSSSRGPPTRPGARRRRSASSTRTSWSRSPTTSPACRARTSWCSRSGCRGSPTARSATAPATSCCSRRRGRGGPSTSGSTSARRDGRRTGARRRATATSRSPSRARARAGRSCERRCARPWAMRRHSST